MFDKKEPEDILDGVMSPPPSQPAATPTLPVAPLKKTDSVAEEETDELERPSKLMRNLAIVLIVILVLIAAALAVYWWIGSQENQPADGGAGVTEQTTSPVETETTGATETEPVVVPEERETDTDRDGLTDNQETELGTNIRLSDTDADGLSDHEEVATWQTDPLDPDTDGDSYIDGAELAAGYDPNGPGKLFELPQE